MFIIKYLKSLMYIFSSIILLSIFIGTLSYFNILNGNLLKSFEIIAIILSMLIGGIYLGKNSNQKGFLEGIKIGLTIIFLLFIFNYFAFDISLTLPSILFYLIILISSILGSIFGINKKSSNN